MVFGEERTRLVQLSMEYDPHPPFAGGSPASADPEVVAKLVTFAAPAQRTREEAARKAATALGLT